MKNDIFISYSRKDYVDDAGNVRPNNILSKVKDAFKANGISYWFDEEGIYSGDEFASIITKSIRNSRMFLFFSSRNSNQSKWASNEISTALEFGKPIIPFRIDSSPYNDSVMMKIVSLDYIECKDEEKAINKLLRAVKYHLSASTNHEKDKWRDIDVPKGAKHTVVGFNVDGKWEKHVFASEEKETRTVHEKLTGDNHCSVNKSYNNKFKDALHKNRKGFSVTLGIVIALFIVYLPLGMRNKTEVNKSSTPDMVSPNLKSEPEALNGSDSQTITPGKKDYMLHPISRNEVKHMIINGSFEKEKGHRLSKNYTIEYVDVSNDDATELQKDFTFIQERLNYGVWHDFDVVEVDYDADGLANCITVRPVY